MKQSLRLGRIAGIPVGLHWGLLVIAGLYLTILGGQVLPQAAPSASTTTHWLVAALGVVLFFGSILAHELGHSLTAKREGIGVRAITLWLLGGVAEIEHDARTPGAEFRIAAAGPAVSVALSMLFIATGVGLEAAFGPSIVATMAWWLGIVNAFLAVFNLVPAAPLDGGRILTSVLWWRSGDPHRSRARSARAGQVFAVVLVGVGVLLLSTGDGVWTLLLAWFVYSGATAERNRAEMMARATRASVEQMMVCLAPPTDAAVTVAGLATMSGPSGRAAFPVRDARGVTVGIVPPAAIRAAVRSRRTDLTAGDLVVPWDRFVAAHTAERAADVADRAIEHGEIHVLVYDLVGERVGYLGLAELAEVPRPEVAGLVDLRR